MARNRNGNLDHGDPYVPDERDPDYQYSEAHGYSDWEPPKRNWVKPAIIFFSLLMLFSMVLPMVLDLLHVLR